MNRIKMTDVISQQFYQLPKAFYNKESKYFALSNNAKVLYSLLKDRLSLSIKNSWHNNNGEVYLIMTRQEITELLGVCENIARKAIKELINIKLIEDERQGLNKPNFIYLSNIDVENLINKGHSKNEGQEPQKMSPNYNDVNLTDVINNTNNKSYKDSKEFNKHKNKEPMINRKEFANANVRYFLDYFNSRPDMQNKFTMIKKSYIDFLSTMIEVHSLSVTEMQIIVDYYIDKYKARKNKSIYLLLTEKVFNVILTKVNIISPEEAFDETGNYNI